jgi:hypothetical protein
VGIPSSFIFDLLSQLIIMISDIYDLSLMICEICDLEVANGDRFLKKGISQKNLITSVSARLIRPNWIYASKMIYLYMRSL